MSHYGIATVSPIRGAILYRDVRHGKWGIVEEPDSVFRLSEVRKWYDSRLKAMTAYERDRRKSCR